MTSWLVAGSTGMVGRALVRFAQSNGIDQIIEVSRKNCDLTNFDEISKIISSTTPDVVIDAAAKVGGIHANSTQPVDFLMNNLQIQNNLFKACHEAKIEKVVFLSSSCVYPKFASQPIKETSLLTGALEETNSAYAIAKITGMRLIQAYREQFKYKWISVMPTNLYGYFDNFSLTSSHVLPAMIRKFYDAKILKKDNVTLWGTGEPRREFLNVDELARAIYFLIDEYDSLDPINVGTGTDIQILELANLVKKIVGFKGEILWDKTKPNGTPRKVLDISKLKSLGFEPKENLEEGLSKTYKWFKDSMEKNPSVLKLN